MEQVDISIVLKLRTHNNCDGFEITVSRNDDKLHEIIAKLEDGFCDLKLNDKCSVKGELVAFYHSFFDNGRSVKPSMIIELKQCTVTGELPDDF